MEQINARSIFSPATGFIKRGGFDWTCNPYVGCTFGCLYCYAMFLPQNRRPREDWGKWLQAKANAIDLARKKAPKLAGKSIYISTVTDPYLPAERSLCLTRGILEELLPFQPRLLIQTRGPLVTRDMDLLKQFDSVRVNISIPTDHEEIRKVYEPKAPPLDQRWLALEDLKSSGIPIGFCITPMLPLRDVDGFVERIAAISPDVLVTQHFHNSSSGLQADTSSTVWDLLAKEGWGEEDYRRCAERLRERLKVYEAEEGFFPPPPKEMTTLFRGATGRSDLAVE